MAVDVPCTHKRNFFKKCSRPVSDHVYVPPEQLPFEGLELFDTMECYVSPNRHDWPVFDVTSGRHVSSQGCDDTRPSMLDLDKEEADAASTASGEHAGGKKPGSKSWTKIGGVSVAHLLR